MGTLFNWLRRRRIFNDCIPQDVLTHTEFANLSCQCTVVSPRCKMITSIILAQDVTCVLTKNGVSIVLDHMSHKELCVLNDPSLSDSVVRSICYNRWNDTIISIWHSQSCNYGLRISIFDRKHVKEGLAKPLNIAPKLQNLIIPYPGFIELEEANGRIVTSTPHDQLFRFWNIKNYEVEFTMENTDFKEIRISKKTVAFFRQPENNLLPVKLCSIYNGEVLVEHKIPLQPEKKLRFLELCEDCLLIKQEGSCIRVYNMLEGKDNRIENTKLFLPNAVTFLMEESDAEPSKFPSRTSTQFLAVHNECMEICCCFNGQLTRLVKISVAPPILLLDCLQVIQKKNIILVYTNRTKRSNYHYKVRNFPFTIENSRKHEIDVINNKQSLKQKFPASSQQLCMIDTEEFGVSIIDLRTGKELAFIPFRCNDIMNVIAYDAVQKQILAGGRHGLHRICTSFTLIETFQDETSSAYSRTENFSEWNSPKASSLIQLEKASTLFLKKK